MAPQKSLPQAKLNLVLSFLRTNAAAYTLKDLEKLLPPAAGISSMVVKDYLASLVADSLLVVEKIGTGNWYWSFPADAKRQKERVLSDVRAERDKITRALFECEQAVEDEKQRLSGGEADNGGERMMLVERLRQLEGKKQQQQMEMEQFKTSRTFDHLINEKERLRLNVNVVIGKLSLFIYKSFD
jgi:hypothetical protein